MTKIDNSNDRISNTQVSSKHLSSTNFPELSYVINFVILKTFLRKAQLQFFLFLKDCLKGQYHEIFLPLIFSSNWDTDSWKKGNLAEKFIFAQ